MNIHLRHANIVVVPYYPGSSQPVTCPRLALVSPSSRPRLALVSPSSNHSDRHSENIYGGLRNVIV